MPAPINQNRRAAIVEAIRANVDGTRPCSRAEIAREFDVSPRTVQRYADAAGIENPWDTTATRAATQSAADRRRYLRSQLADDLLTIDIPRLRERMAGAESWRKRTALPSQDGPEVVVMAEDDAVIAKGLQTLMTALGIAVDKTIVIDKHDVGTGDDGAAELLAELGATLAGYAGRRRGDEPER